MKKINILWTLILVPIIFIAAKNPIINDIIPDNGINEPCATYGHDEQPFNGNGGCYYDFDFTDEVSCNLKDVDLNRSLANIQHENENDYASWWTSGDGIIHMLPKPGFGGPGFVVSCDITASFTDGSPVNVTWTCDVVYSPPPYQAPCY